jgi:ABC-type transporter Mla MlaB component
LHTARDVELWVSGDETIAKFHGPIDEDSATTFNEFVADLTPGSGPVTLDFSDVDFVNSSGVRHCARFMRELAKSHDLSLGPCPDNLAAVLRNAVPLKVASARADGDARKGRRRTLQARIASAFVEAGGQASGELAVHDVAIGGLRLYGDGAMAVSLAKGDRVALHLKGTTAAQAIKLAARVAYVRPPAIGLEIVEEDLALVLDYLDIVAALCEASR